MPDEETGTDAPGTDSDAPVDTLVDTGDDTEARHSGFLDMLEGKTTPSEKDPSEEDETDQDDEVEEKPVVKADDKKDAKTDEEDADEDDDETILTKEEIDAKFPTANKTLRKMAARMGAKYGPIAEAINELGGIEAVK